MTQAWLCDAQLLGGFHVMLEFCKGDKVTKLIQIHKKRLLPAASIA